MWDATSAPLALPAPPPGRNPEPIARELHSLPSSEKQELELTVGEARFTICQ